MPRVFLGEFKYTLDRQRRVSIPKEWRLDDAEEDVFFLMPGRDHTIQGLPYDLFMSQVYEKLKGVSFAEKNRTLAKIGRFGYETRKDGQHRITISPMLMKLIGVEPGDEVVLTGAITGFEIRRAEEENLEASVEDFLDEINALMSQNHGE